MVDRQALRIHGLTVSVDYAEELAIGLPRWLAGLETLLVVTTERDVATQRLCHDRGARVLVTDAFYQDGAAFNKGRALELGRQAVPSGDWLLLFDADVVPPDSWIWLLQHCTPGHLYGCKRFAATPEAFDDSGRSPDLPYDVPGVGYFQLFHTADPVVVGADPLLEIHWQHAGNYDNRLMDRWRRAGRPIRSVPFRVAHLGGHHQNWFGRGNQAAFDAMREERRRRGGRWDHETISTPILDRLADRAESR
jgi:hypothetical protein